MARERYKIVAALSGGLDSAVALGWAIDRGHEIALAVGFTYGSKHNPYENRAAALIADHYQVPFWLCDLTGVMSDLKSSLMKNGPAVPEGHYEAESMRQTVVPGRNLIFISILAAMAESMKADRVMLGVHAGDHFIYPDCRPEFIAAADTAIYRSSDKKVVTFTPFLHSTKHEIVGSGIECRVPFHLTRTCYKAQPVACGKCGSCQERLEAFKLSGMTDPLEYETRELLPKSK